MEPNATSMSDRHKSPPLWLLATLYTLLFSQGLFPLTMLASGQNWAQCRNGLVIKPHVSWRGAPNANGILLLPLALQDEDGANHREHSRASIVVFWHVVFTANTLNGSPIPDTPIDNPLITWHRDGAEIMNSGRPPQGILHGRLATNRSAHLQAESLCIRRQYIPSRDTQRRSRRPGPAPRASRKSMKVSADGTHYIGNGTFTLVAHQPNGEAYAAFTGLLTGTRITLERQWPTFSNHPTTAQG